MGRLLALENGVDISAIMILVLVRKFAWSLLPLGLLPSLLAIGDPLDDLEKVATEWAKTRGETVREETEWRTQRELLESLIKAQEEKIQPLEAKLETVKQKMAKEETENETLASRNAACVEQLKRFEGSIGVLDAELAKLRPLLPPRLSSALDLAYRSLANPALPANERMQLTLSVLNRCVQFSKILTCGDEIISIEGGTQKLLKTVYLGLSVGYAWDRVSGTAWTGHPASSGWKWELAPDAAAAVSAFITAYGDKAEPHYINLRAQTGHKL